VFSLENIEDSDVGLLSFLDEAALGDYNKILRLDNDELEGPFSAAVYSAVFEEDLSSPDSQELHVDNVIPPFTRDCFGALEGEGRVGVGEGEEVGLIGVEKNDVLYVFLAVDGRLSF
jgi:hypothetical protein